MDLLNPQTLQTFGELMSPQELHDFLAFAAQELAAAGERLQQLQAQGDWGGVRAQAHRLKGTMGSLGCDALFAALDELDEGLKSLPERIPAEEEMAWIARLIVQTLQALQTRGA